MTKKKEECKIEIKRDFFGRPIIIKTSGKCSHGHVKSTLKNRDIIFNDINLIKAN